MSQALLPCTPEALNIPTFPVAIAARSLVELLDLQTCIAFVRVCSRAFSSSILAIKIRERSDTFARQRQRRLRLKHLLPLVGLKAGRSSLVPHRAVPPPRPTTAAAAATVAPVTSGWVVDTQVDLE